MIIMIMIFKYNDLFKSSFNQSERDKHVSKQI